MARLDTLPHSAHVAATTLRKVPLRPVTVIRPVHAAPKLVHPTSMSAL
jgi:hypothetical protein